MSVHGREREDVPVTPGLTARYEQSRPVGTLVLPTTTRSVFANDKFVKLMQDVTRQRKIFEK